jgi:hypothetical protein
LFVRLFVVIYSFIAALTACLCGRLVRSSRHGTSDNDDGHCDDETRLPVFGGAYGAGRLWRTSAWGRAGRAFVFRSGRFAGVCLSVGRFARSLVLVASASVASALLRDGLARVGAWVGSWQCRA